MLPGMLRMIRLSAQYAIRKVKRDGGGCTGGFGGGLHHRDVDGCLYFSLASTAPLEEVRLDAMIDGALALTVEARS